VQPAAVDSLAEPGGLEGFLMVLQASLARDIERWSTKLGRPIQLGELEPTNAALVEGGRSVTATQYVAGMEAIHAYSRAVAPWWADGNDILVLPTCPLPPATLAELDPKQDAGAFARINDYAEFTVPFNLTGQPVISLPLHWMATGLPVGVQLVAAYGREDILIRLAGQLEEAQPWADRHPPAAAL
jgi:amidase